jgi:APA family basic amino acid/polyamine antiporter
VSVIYIVANVMYLAVVAFVCYCRIRSCSCGEVINYFGSVGTLIIAVMIMISTFACNNGLIMAGARV